MWLDQASAGSLTTQGRNHKNGPVVGFKKSEGTSGTRFITNSGRLMIASGIAWPVRKCTSSFEKQLQLWVRTS